MIIKGFRFGMLLQVAIGSVCVFIFKTANDYGILAAESAALAATIADALFVALAILGVGTVLEKPRVKLVMKYFGAIVLVYYGFGIILDSFGIIIIPQLSGKDNIHAISNAFMTSFVLTASSPLTIVFWAGVFASKVSDGFGKKEMVLFGAGAVMATLIFSSAIAIFVGAFHIFISEMLVKILNISVGVVFVILGLLIGIKKDSTKRVESKRGFQV